jgi:hypothetical protein
MTKPQMGRTSAHHQRMINRLPSHEKASPGVSRLRRHYGSRTGGRGLPHPTTPSLRRGWGSFVQTGDEPLLHASGSSGRGAARVRSDFAAGLGSFVRVGLQACRASGLAQRHRPAPRVGFVRTRPGSGSYGSTQRHSRGSRPDAGADRSLCGRQHLLSHRLVDVLLAAVLAHCAGTSLITMVTPPRCSTTVVPPGLVSPCDTPHSSSPSPPFSLHRSRR